MEVPGAVVPPREQARFVVALTKGIHEAPLLERSQSLALGLADVRGPHEACRVVEVAVLGSDVEVYTDGQGRGRIAVLYQVGTQLSQPVQLGLVVLAADAASVGDVHARHPHVAAEGADEAPLGGGAPALVGEARRDVLHADPAQDGHPVPPTGPVVGRLVAQGREGQGRDEFTDKISLPAQPWPVRRAVDERPAAAE